MNEIIIGALIKLFARIAGKDPIEWLVSVSRSADLDQEKLNKLIGVL